MKIQNEFGEEGKDWAIFRKSTVILDDIHYFEVFLRFKNGSPKQKDLEMSEYLESLEDKKIDFAENCNIKPFYCDICQIFNGIELLTIKIGIYSKNKQGLTTRITKIEKSYGEVNSYCFIEEGKFYEIFGRKTIGGVYDLPITCKCLAKKYDLEGTTSIDSNGGINFTINKKDPNMSDKLVRKQCGIEALKLLEIHEEMKTW